MTDEWNMSTEHSWIDDDKGSQKTVKKIPAPGSPLHHKSQPHSLGVKHRPLHNNNNNNNNNNYYYYYYYY
jgi:hypothetical protein